MMRRTSLRTGLLVILTVVTQACTGGQSDDLKPPAPEAQMGGTINIGITQPTAIEPQAASPFDPASYLISSLICDPLASFDPVTGELKPAIAESFVVQPSASTIRMRQDVKFHNGREVNARDAVYALSRTAQSEYASPASRVVRHVAGFDIVHGDIDLRDLDVDDEQLEIMSGLVAVDNFAFTMATSVERPDMDRSLGHVLTAPIPKEETRDEPDAQAAKPVCTGPYQLSEPWGPDDGTISLTKFADYYRNNLAFTNGGAGYADGYSFTIYESFDAAIKDFLAGKIDVTYVPQELMGRATKGAKGKFFTAPNGAVQYVALPTGVAPFDLPAVRVAMSQALNRTRLAAGPYGGFASAATGFYPPTIADFHDADRCKTQVPSKTSIKAVNENLKKAGVSFRGARMSFYFNDEFQNRALAAEIAKQWEAALGVRFTLVGLNWDEFLQRSMQQDGFDGPSLFGWGSQYPSPDEYLAPLFASTEIGNTNVSRYNSRAFDLQLREARRSEDADRLKLFYSNLEETACTEMAMVPLVFREWGFLVATDKVGSATGEFLDRTTGLAVLRELFSKNPN